MNLIVASQVEDFAHIDRLVSAICGGSRRRFSVVTKEQLFEQVKAPFHQNSPGVFVDSGLL